MRAGAARCSGDSAAIGMRSDTIEMLKKITNYFSCTVVCYVLTTVIVVQSTEEFVLAYWLALVHAFVFAVLVARHIFYRFAALTAAVPMAKPLKRNRKQTFGEYLEEAGFCFYLKVSNC